MRKTKALKIWLAEVIAEHPEIMTTKHATAIDFYAMLYPLWATDIQISAKELFNELKP